MHSARAKGDDATGKSKGSDKGKCKGKGFGKATGQERQRPKNAKGQSKGKDAKGKSKNFGKSNAWDRLVEQENALHEQAIIFSTSCSLENIHPEKFETADRYIQNRKVQLDRRRAVLETADKAARLWGNAQKKGGAINMMPKHLPPVHSVILRPPPVARCATEKSAASAPEPPKSKPPGHSGIPRPPPGMRRQPPLKCKMKNPGIVEEVLDDGEVVEEGDEDVEEVSEGEDPLTAGSSHPPASPQPQWRKEWSRKMQQVGGEEDGRRSSMASDESAQTYLKMPQQMLLTGVLCKEHSVPKEYTPCRYFFKLNNNGGCKLGEHCSFSHDPIFQESEVEEWPKGSCKYFASSGGCRKGQACLYQHVGKPGREKKLAKNEAMQSKRIMESSTTITDLKQRLGQMPSGEALQWIVDGVLQTLQPDDEEVRPWKKKRGHLKNDS